MSVQLWNFKEGGSQKARFLAKNKETIVFCDKIECQLIKLGMILEDKLIQKLKLEWWFLAESLAFLGPTIFELQQPNIH